MAADSQCTIREARVWQQSRSEAAAQPSLPDLVRALVNSVAGDQCAAHMYCSLQQIHNMQPTYETASAFAVRVRAECARALSGADAAMMAKELTVVLLAK